MSYGSLGSHGRGKAEQPTGHGADIVSLSEQAQMQEDAADLHATET